MTYQFPCRISNYALWTTLRASIKIFISSIVPILTRHQFLLSNTQDRTPTPFSFILLKYDFGFISIGKIIKLVFDSTGLNPSFFDDHLKMNLNFKGMLIDNNFSNQGAIGTAVSFDPTQWIYSSISYIFLLFANKLNQH